MSTAMETPMVVPAAPTAEATPTHIISEVSEKPVAAAEPKVEEPATVAGEVPAPAEEKKEEELTEPITHGALGYKAPGLKK
jgi:hypothetical protein